MDSSYQTSGTHVITGIRVYDGKVSYTYAPMPTGGTDTSTDTWRNVYVNNTEFKGTDTSTSYVNFVAGSGIQITSGGTNKENDIIISSTNTKEVVLVPRVEGGVTSVEVNKPNTMYELNGTFTNGDTIAINLYGLNTCNIETEWNEEVVKFSTGSGVPILSVEDLLGDANVLWEGCATTPELHPNAVYEINISYDAVSGQFTLILGEFGVNSSGSGGGGVTKLSQLGDVSLNSPTLGQILTYNGSKWVNANATGISGQSSSFSLGSRASSNNYARTSSVETSPTIISYNVIKSSANKVNSDKYISNINLTYFSAGTIFSYTLSYQYSKLPSYTVNINTDSANATTLGDGVSSFRFISDFGFSYNKNGAVTSYTLSTYTFPGLTTTRTDGFSYMYYSNEEGKEIKIKSIQGTYMPRIEIPLITHSLSSSSNGNLDQVYNIEVCSTPGTSPNTLYIVI